MPWIEPMPAAGASLGQGLSVFLLSYVLGCFAAGYYLVRLRTGKDVRELGSGSVGATNVGRLLGPLGFALTVLIDFAKGALAVWFAARFTDDHRLAALALLAVVSGHIWPAQLRFHGGKGVATSLGALIVYELHLSLTFIGLFAVLFVLLRRITASGLAAFGLLPLAGMFVAHDPMRIVIVSILAGMVLIAHRKNLAEEVCHFTDRHDDVQPKPNP